MPDPEYKSDFEKDLGGPLQVCACPKCGHTEQVFTGGSCDMRRCPVCRTFMFRQR